MKKLSNTEMITHLSRFREAGDKLSEDVFELSSLLLNISTELEKKGNKNPEEQEIYDKISSNTNLILKSILHANEYNNTLWEDYSPVIKLLGKEGIKNNG
ncbi:hypothetical protein CG435_10845 [Pantoea ananatis]|uniref:hypothetical protein n=1 Tax=Pantoea ananas TaxID=553 RepID=UPI000D3FD812|nr:hypothetical protein [Pantoea ananatis]MDF7789595.1 hypothetical protein [Pantoea ananatis]PQK99594.1 hypothetical protein CG435_10845 [Pantoea ananatis]